MASAQTIAQVREAVRVLYSSSLQQAEANQWLTSFQQSQEAWEAGLALISASESQEVQFFAATLLVRKVRSEWGKLNDTMRQMLAQSFRNKLEETMSWPNATILVLRQLCVLLAAVVGAGGGNGATDAISLAMQLLHAPNGSLLCFELLAAIAGESEDLDRVHRSSLVKSLMPCARDVLIMVGSMLRDAVMQNPAVAAGALKCTAEWFRLNPVAGSGSLSGPGDILEAYPDLFRSLLFALQHNTSSDEVVSGAGNTLLILLGGAFGSDENKDISAFSELLQTLISMEPRLTVSGQGCSETVAVTIAQLGSAAAERSPEICSGQIPEALPFASVMLACIDRREFSVVESCLEYFLMVNTVPLAERAPQLTLPLYQEMLQRLIPHASYPSDFTTWEESTHDIDADDFLRMRRDIFPEALEVAYGLLRYNYLSHAWQLLQGAKTWKDAESALYIVSAVALTVKARLLGDAAQQNSPIAEDASRSGELLKTFFSAVCSPQQAQGILSSNPALSSTACTLIEKYATWFGKANNAPLQDALAFLVAALKVPGTGAAAAKAFNSICVRCGVALNNPAAVSSLITTMHQTLGLVNGTSNSLLLTVEDWEAVASGLARLASQLPIDDQRNASVCQLTDPFITVAQTSSTTREARHTAVMSLSLLSASLSQLGPSSCAIAMYKSMDVLNTYATSPIWQADEPVATALVNVYKQAICSAKQGGKELLPALLPALSSLFTATALPSCLDVYGEALELQYQDEAVVTGVNQVFTTACQSVAFPRLQGSGLRDYWPLTSAVLALADTFAVYAPSALWSGPLLVPLTQLATATLALRESDPVSKALNLLSHITSAHDRAAADDTVRATHLEAVYGALSTQGPGIMAALMRGLCDTCPRRHMRNAADCVRSLLAHPLLTSTSSRWFGTAVVDEAASLPGMTQGYIIQDDCNRLCSIVLGGQLRGGRLIALLVDFGLVARGENTSDVLLAYEM